MRLHEKIITYYTNYSIEDTIGLLEQKNIYDTLNYKLKRTKQGMFIIFTDANTHWRGDVHTKYAITFSSVGECTEVSLNFISESLVLPVPLIPDKWIDEFMDVKLDAKRSRLDVRTSCDVDREEKMNTLEKKLVNMTRFKMVVAIIMAFVAVHITVFFLYVLFLIALHLL